MKFEFFNSKTYESTKKPLATIGANRQSITLNKAAMTQYNLKAEQLVSLGFDRKTNTIGIKLLNKPTDGARKIIAIRNQKHIVTAMWITAHKFFKAFNITQIGRFSLNYDKKSKILYFSLKFEGKL